MDDQLIANIQSRASQDNTADKVEGVRKARKPKPINFIDKKTFRLGEEELRNLKKGAEEFNGDQSEYIRILLRLPPSTIKSLVSQLENVESVDI